MLRASSSSFAKLFPLTCTPSCLLVTKHFFSKCLAWLLLLYCLTIPLFSPAVSASSLCASPAISELMLSAGSFPLTEVLSLPNCFSVTCCSTSDFFFWQPFGLLLAALVLYSATQPSCSAAHNFSGGGFCWTPGPLLPRSVPCLVCVALLLSPLLDVSVFPARWVHPQPLSFPRNEDEQVLRKNSTAGCFSVFPFSAKKKNKNYYR